MNLTRADILDMDDISVKELTVPDHIPAWGGKTVFIRQLSRGQQDEYLKRQFGAMRMKQDPKARNQEIVATNIYGHDAWIFIQGVCDASGKPLFSMADEKLLAAKNGEAVGWVAKEVIEFSGMKGDVNTLETVEGELKNSLEIQT